MRLRCWLLAGVFASGCFAPADSGLAGESYMDPDLPPYSCMDSGDAGDSTGACETTAGEVAECVGSDECPGGAVCTANFDGEIGVFGCQAACVLDEDDTSWCSDDAACCSDGATCLRGLCIPGEVGETTTLSSEGTGTTGATDTTGTAAADGTGSGSTTSGSGSSG